VKKNRLFHYLGFFIVFQAAASGTSIPLQQSAQTNWPQVEALRKEYDFPDALRAAVDLTLRDTSGKKIYTLHCRPGSLILKPGKAITLPNDPGFWGDFDCHVHSLYERDKYESLLIENPLDNDEGHSRGEFYFYELQGSCLEYPEWGRKRSFRFRGMRLELELTNIQFSAEPPPGRLASFGFRVEVTPDPAALSAISEPPAFLIPAVKLPRPDPRFASCDNPVPQHVPGIVTREYVRDLGLDPPYPIVAKMTKELRIDPSIEGDMRPSFPGKITSEPAGRFATLQIRALDGKPAYDFDCVAYRIIGATTPQIAGDGLTCGLFVPGKKTNLLLDSVDPYSRMSPTIVLARQLRGAAAKNPEWGNRRHFSLRGFSLTLTFANSVFGRDEFGNPTLVRSDLTLQVEPDPSAQSPVADPPKTAYSAFLPSIRAGD
jgi:hypothetical protein